MSDKDSGSTTEDFFDSSFVRELEELALGPGLDDEAATAASDGLHEKLASFLAPLPGAAEARPLSEDEFLALTPGVLSERTNALIDICRAGGNTRAVHAVENFIVFFQALVPTLAEGSAEVKRLFFRLVPTLIHIAYNDFSTESTEREEGVGALRNLETILIEISNVRLAPSEVDLVFRSIDNMAAFIGAGEYTMANEIISSQLLSIISRNKLTRALYRLMEVEVSLQRYLHQRLGHTTPMIRVPEDLAALAEYGPLRVMQEDGFDGPATYVQVQLPDIPILRDIVLRLAQEGTSRIYDLRFDALGSAPLDVPSGTYSLGLVYQPEGTDPARR